MRLRLFIAKVFKFSGNKPSEFHENAPSFLYPNFEAPKSRGVILVTKGVTMHRSQRRKKHNEQRYDKNAPGQSRGAVTGPCKEKKRPRYVAWVQYISTQREITSAQYEYT